MKFIILFKKTCQDFLTNYIIPHIYMWSLRHQMFTIFDYFSETGCIWIRNTVNNGGTINSRLHVEVFVFILIYSQHSFIIYIKKTLNFQFRGDKYSNYLWDIFHCYCLHCVTIFFRGRLHKSDMRTGVWWMDSAFNRRII